MSELGLRLGYWLAARHQLGTQQPSMVVALGQPPITAGAVGPDGVGEEMAADANLLEDELWPPSKRDGKSSVSEVLERVCCLAVAFRGGPHGR
jgi:hypothetical protein